MFEIFVKKYMLIFLKLLFGILEDFVFPECGHVSLPKRFICLFYFRKMHFFITLLISSLNRQKSKIYIVAPLTVAVCNGFIFPKSFYLLLPIYCFLRCRFSLLLFSESNIQKLLITEKIKLVLKKAKKHTQP